MKKYKKGDFLKSIGFKEMLKEQDKIDKQIDEIIGHIDGIFLMLAGAKLIADMDKYMAVKEAEYIVKDLK